MGAHWRTFLRNHSPDIAAMDLFVAPTLGFDLLYVFIIVRLARRPVQRAGSIISHALLGGLHHHYVRV